VLVSRKEKRAQSQPSSPTQRQQENVAIANALQLEAARRRAVPIRFNSSPVPCMNSLSLSVAVLERFTAYTLRYAVTLNFDPVTLTFTFDLEHL